MSSQTPLKRVPYTRTLAMAAVGVFTIVSILSGAFAFHPGIALAANATNDTLNFQARLETDTGAIVPDGTYNVQFKLYDGDTSGGPAGKGAGFAGINLWTETYQNSNGQGLQVRDGYLTANLGSITAFPGTINWDQGLWLTLNVGGTTTTASVTWDGEMNPRLKLTGVPYAFRAGQLAAYNSTSDLTSTLQLLQPSVGNQIFQIADQGAAGTYTLCIQNSADCGFAAATGDGGYIQNSTGGPQSANFNIQSPGGVTARMQAAASGSSDILDIAARDGTVKAGFDLNGKLFLGTSAIPASTTARLYVTQVTPMDTVQIIRGAASQTGDLLDLQHSSGTNLIKIDADGNLTANGTTGTFNGLTYPGGVTVTANGTTGTTTYAYRVSAINSQGETVASPEVTEANGAATLSAGNYNTVSWNSVPGATSYKVYGRASGAELFMVAVTATGSPSYSWNDTGIVTPSGALPTGSGFGPVLAVQAGNASGVNPTFTVRNNSGQDIFTSGGGYNGAKVFGTLLINNANSNNSPALQLTNNLGTTVAAYIQGASAQSADLLDMRNTYGYNVSGFDSNGGLYAYGTNNSFNALTTPAITAVTPGTVYYYKVTAASSQTGTTTVASNEVGTNGSSGITWPAVPGAGYYRVYRGTSPGAENFYNIQSACSSGTTCNFTDVGAVPFSGTPPTSTVGSAFTLQAWLGQTGNILNVLNSSSNPIAKITNTGDFFANVGGFGTQSGLGVGTAQLGVKSRSATAPGEVIQAASGQSADLLQLLASDGTTVLSKFDSNGNLTVPTITTTGNALVGNGLYTVGAILAPITGSPRGTIIAKMTGTSGTSEVGLLIQRGASTNTADSFQIQDASANILARFDNSGNLIAPTLNATTGVNTGPGNGTQRINANGDLTNIASISANSETLVGSFWQTGTSSSNYMMSVLGLGTTNPQAGGALTIANGKWISGIDAAGTGYVNMFQVNASNQIQVGAALNVDGGIVLPTDGGQLTLVDMGIDSGAADSTPESYSLRVGSSNALTIYGESDGAGGTKNVRVAIGSAISPQYALDVGGEVNISSSSTYRIGGTEIVGNNANQGFNEVAGDYAVRGFNVANSNFYLQSYNGASTTLFAGLSGTYAGRIGIGTTSPNYKLDVNGDINIQSGSVLRIGGVQICSSTGCTGGGGGSGSYVTLQGTPPGTPDVGSFNINGTGIAGILQAGTFDTAATGTLSIGTTNATTINIGANSTGAISLGQSTATNTINIGNGTITSGNTQTVNIATAASGSGQTAVSIGSSNGASSLLLQAGTGGINFITSNATAGVSIKTFTNTSAAFVVQNSDAQPILQADTTHTVSKLNNGGFDAIIGGAGGWAATGTGASITRTTTASQIYSGDGALAVTLGSVSGTGAQSQSSNIVGGSLAASTYTISFYAKGSAAIAGLVVTLSGGGTCTLNSTTVSAAGFQRYFCTVTTSSATTTINFTATTTGQTLYLDSIQVQAGGTASTYTEGALHLTGVIGSPLTLQNASDSTSVFQIQNAAGTTTLFNVDTLNNQISTGGAFALQETVAPSATSGYGKLYVSSSDHNLHFINGSGVDITVGAGAGSHVKAITMVPEYAGATFSPSGTNNTGFMSANYVRGLAAAQGYKHNYYDWTTDQATAQNYDIVTQYQIPSDFSSFVGGSWKLWTYTDSLTSTGITWDIRSATDADCYASAQSALPGSTGVWQQISLSNPGNGCTFAAGDVITIDINATAIQPSTNQVRIGEFTYQYNTAY